MGSVSSNSTTRAKLQNQAGTDLIVTVGKTLYIGYVTYTMSVAGGLVYIMYDNDGAGTGEVIVCKLPAIGAQAPITLPIVAAIPSGKYVTVKVGASGETVYFFCEGFER